MAITATNLSTLKRTSSSDVTSFTSNAEAFSSGTLYFILVANDDGEATANTPTALTSDGPVTITWTQVATVAYATIASSLYRLTLYRGIGDGNTGTVTATFSDAQTGCNLSGLSVSGADTAVSQGVVQSATNRGDSGTAISATLAAFGNPTDNAGLIFVGSDGSGSFAPEAGWSEIIPDLTHSTPTNRNAAAFRTGQDTSPSYTIGSAANWGAIAVEVKAPDVGEPPAGFPLTPPNIAGTATLLVDSDPNNVWNLSGVNALDPGTDYVLSVHPNRTRPIYLESGRDIIVGATISGGNLVLEGYTIVQGATGGGAFFRIEDGNQTASRVIFSYGARWDANGFELDGFKTRGPNNKAENTILKILNTRIVGLTGTTPTVHADLIQLSGGVGELWVEDFTGETNYAGFQLQQEMDEVVGSSRTISALTRIGQTCFVTTSTAHGLIEGDYVGIWGASPAAYNGGYTVAGVASSTSFTYNIDDDVPSSPASGTINMIKMVLQYAVGPIHIKRANVRGLDNPSPAAPSEALNGIRFAGRSASNAPSGGSGYTREREDQTNITVESWAGTAEFLDFYVKPFVGTGADFIKPPATASTYSVCRGTLTGTEITFPTGWTAVTGSINIGDAPTPSGDFVPANSGNVSRTAAISGVGSLTAVGQIGVPPSVPAHLSGTGSLTATGQISKRGQAHLSGSGTLAANITVASRNRGQGKARGHGPGIDDIPYEPPMGG